MVVCQLQLHRQYSLEGLHCNHASLPLTCMHTLTQCRSSATRHLKFTRHFIYGDNKSSTIAEALI